MHLLPTPLDAGGRPVQRMPRGTVLRFSDAALQELPPGLSKVHRLWEIQLRGLLAPLAPRQTEQSVRALLHGQREGWPGRGVLPLRPGDR